MASFWPGSGGGGGLAPGLNPATIYVSPEGSNGNDGKTWQSAMKNGYNGYAKIVTAGGGYLNIANGTEWGGPVAGQGCWLRGDGLTVPGWQAVVPCIITGFGPGASPANPFQQPGSAVLYAGSNDAADFRLKPAVWECYTERPVTFRNIQTKPSLGHTDSQIANYLSFRIGWDYNRNEDANFTPLSQAITSSTRTGSAGNGSTVHTVALSPAITVTTAQRTSNITTLTIPRPATVKYPPWKAGTKIYFNYTGGGGTYTSGGYTVLSCAAAVDSDANWDVTYSETAANAGPTASPGTVRSLVSSVDDLVDVQSSSAEFPSTQYLVTASAIVSSSTGTITVFDPYGGYNGTTAAVGPVANIGVILNQSRGYNSTTNTQIFNCSNRGGFDADQYLTFGPQFDFGGNLAITPTLDSCYLEGLFPTVASGAPYDSLRMSACLVYGDRVSSGGLYASNLTGQQASMRVSIGQFFAKFSLNKATFDTSSGAGEAPAAYEIQGSDSSFIYLQDVIVADAGGSYGAYLNSITNVPAINISGNSATGFDAGAVGPASNAIPQATGISPWIDLQIGTWADLRITGKHPAAQRNISPTHARFNNLTSVAGWLNAPDATGIADPTGGTGAVSFDDSVNFNGKSGTKIINGATETFFAAGGHYVVAGWFNYDSGNYDGAGLISWAGTGDIIWESSGTAIWTKQVPFRGAGWQYVVFSDKVVSASASQTYDVGCFGVPPSSGLTARWFGLQCFWIPETISDNDVAEYIGTLRSQPYYLKAGMTGTFEDQKFIAHGGSGIATGITKVVGGGSGQLTLTGAGTTYEPRYGADGTTILGWVALLQATVNP